MKQMLLSLNSFLGWAVKILLKTSEEIKNENEIIIVIFDIRKSV